MTYSQACGTSSQRIPLLPHRGKRVKERDITLNNNLQVMVLKLKVLPNEVSCFTNRFLAVWALFRTLVVSPLLLVLASSRGCEDVCVLCT